MSELPLMPIRSLRRRVWAVVAVLSAVAGLLTVADLATPAAPAQAADASKFDPGMIMSDQVFYNANALTAAQAQSFIVSKGGSCTNNGSVPCLKNLSVSSPTIAANQYCAAIAARSGLNAGTVFATVATACGISPSVLITLVEKEQSLVSTSTPTSYMYQKAAGFACPDTAPCDPNFSGFFSQVYAAARQFQIYRANPNSFNYQAGRVNNIHYSPTASCGTEAVYIKNQATAGLYDYTPYVPNKAALANLYGTGDSCSAYGNRNFWRIYSDWFGDPTGTLLSCPTFDGCTTGWEFQGSIDRALYTDSNVHSGSGYLALVPHATNSGLRQVVNRSVSVGNVYEGSIWIKTAVAGQTSTGKLVVWGLGGSGNENSVKSFTVGSTWTQIVVDFQAAQLSHSQIALQLYVDTANIHLAVDDASLTQLPSQSAKTTVPLQSPSFESGADPWPTSNGFVNRAIYSGGAQDGKQFFASNTTVAGRSFAQDVNWPVSTATSYTASIWLRSASGNPYTGKLVLWALGSTNSNAVTSFTVGGTWTQVQVTLPVNAAGQTKLRLEVYETTLAPETLYVDNASLTTNQFADGSLESGAGGWTPHESGTNLQVYNSGSSISAVDGARYAATSTSVASGSVTTTLTRDVWNGQTYTASLWVRANDMGATFTGRLALWELGPDGNSNAVVDVSVGNSWKKFTVTKPIENSSSTSLMLQLYEGKTGVNVDFDGGVLN
jgi:hypothetical protein